MDVARPLSSLSFGVSAGSWLNLRPAGARTSIVPLTAALPAPLSVAARVYLPPPVKEMLRYVTSPLPLFDPGELKASAPPGPELIVSTGTLP